MLIKCPKCHAVYDLPDHEMSDKGLRMRCAECQNIWTASLSDALKEKKQPRTDIDKMFQNLAKETESLFEPKQPRVVEKVKIVTVSKGAGRPHPIWILIFLLSVVGILYYMRYEIVRWVPQVESLYTRLGIRSVPYGKNLEFRSIQTNEFSEDNIARLGISGTVVNVGKYASDLPPLQIEIRDQSDQTLASIFYILPLPRLEAGYHILFNATMTNPTAFGKSVYVKFVDPQTLKSGE